MKKSGVPRARTDLEQSIEEQIGFLETSTRLYDEGTHAEAKRLAITMRILLHDTSGSKSLINQLGFGFLDFYDSPGELLPGNLLTDSPLVMMAIGGSGPDYLPLLDEGPFAPKPKPFLDWWHQVVFLDDQHNAFSRRDIILSVADQDGGAHVDPCLNHPYHRLSRDNSLAWVVGGPSSKRPAHNPVPAAIRQIAHEVLKSLRPVRVKLV